MGIQTPTPSAASGASGASMDRTASAQSGQALGGCSSESARVLPRSPLRSPRTPRQMPVHDMARSPTSSDIGNPGIAKRSTGAASTPPHASSSTTMPVSPGYAFPPRPKASSVSISDPTPSSLTSHHAPTSPTHQTTRASMSEVPLNTAQHRLSFSGIASRPRRPSPLLHEIQPPARRLSAHQVMLLTPFGGAISLPSARTSMSAALDDGGGMRRESSSMGMGERNDAHIGSGQSRRGSGMSSMGDQSPGRTRMTSLSRPIPGSEHRGGSSRGGGVGDETGSPRETSPLSMLDRRNSALAALAASGTHPPRTRHSLASSVPLAGPSPLAISQPLTTIVSNSDHSSSNPSSAQPSRGPSHDPEYEDAIDGAGEVNLQLVALNITGTVEMTRSNSLPVLTIRELEAMRDKDGELGIERGGDWAWVSRGDDNLDELDSLAEMDADDRLDNETFESTTTPSLDTPGSAQSQSRSSSHSLFAAITPPNQSTFAARPPPVLFNDPFSAVAGAGLGRGADTPPPSAGYRRTEHTAGFENYKPVATSEGYLYATGSEARRSSETPASASSQPSLRMGAHSSRRKVDDRRPSAPVVGLRYDDSPANSGVGGSGFARDAITTQDPALASSARGPESPRGTPLPGPSRPRILRYKTSPARFTGLGLSIVVQSNTARDDSLPTVSGGEARRSSALSSGSTESSGASTIAPAHARSEALSTVGRRERRYARLRHRATAGGSDGGSGSGSFSGSIDESGVNEDVSPISPNSPSTTESARWNTRGSVTSGPVPRSGVGSRSGPQGAIGMNAFPASRSRLGSWTSVGVLDGLEAEAYRLPPDVERRLSDRTGSISSVSSRGSISGPVVHARRSSATLGGGQPELSPRNVVLSESTRGMTLSEFGVPRGPTSASVSSEPALPGAGAKAEDEGQARGKVKGRFDSLDSAFPRSRTRASIVAHPLYGAGVGFGDATATANANAAKSTSIEAGAVLEQSRFDTFPRRSSLAVLTQLETLGGGLVGLWTRRQGSLTRAGSGGSGKARLLEESGLGEVASESGESGVREWYHRRGSWAEGWQSGRE